MIVRYGVVRCDLRTAVRMSCSVVLALAIGLTGSARAQAGPDTTLSAADVRAALIPRINDGTFRGLAAAWRAGDSLRVASVGVVAAHAAPIDASTIFEFGELDELLVSALLSDMVVHGELSLDDLAQRFMPPGIRLPTRDGRAITLGDLAFHRSGLPPGTGTSATAAGRINQRMGGLRLQAPVASRYEFSRLGIDVLAVALSRQLHMPLERAIELRILEPLGIASSISARPPGAQERMQVAVGHAATGQALGTPNRTVHVWHGSVLGLAQFAAAAADTARGPLAGTFALMMRSRSIGPEATLPVALGWRVLEIDGRDVYWHDALDAAGFAAFVAAEPQSHRASVVLGNTAHAVDAIAGQLLLGEVPVVAASPVATPIVRPLPPAPRRPTATPRRRSRP